MNRTGTVYMASDDTGQLLYVGSTDDILRRLREHRTKSAWWEQRDWLGYADISQLHLARLFEQKLIGEFEPKLNIQHRGKPQPGMPSGSTLDDMRAVEALLVEYMAHQQECLTKYQDSMAAFESLRASEVETLGECQERLRKQGPIGTTTP